MKALAATAAAAAVLLLASGAGAQDDARVEAFRRAASLGLEPLLAHVFADDSVLAALDRLPEDGVLRLDLHGDGTIDGLAWREGATRVAVIDESGHLRPGDRRPDNTNACYVADPGGHGIPERVVEYKDTDGDGIPDRQEIYELLPGDPAREGVYATVVFDLDHKGTHLFHLTDYGYHANQDMWDTNFDGNLCFVAGSRDEKTGVWTSAYENPFCFYDDDGDGHADEALRFEGTDLTLSSIRWSFDADGALTPQDKPAYDFSLTATGTVVAPAAMADSVVMRDGRALRFVSWARARDLARWAYWRKALLVWDEEGHNVAPQSDHPDRERWEGVIADAFLDFPQVGGPSCGRINKRYEIRRGPSAPLALYASGVDDRIHLLDAERGETDIVFPASPPLGRTLLTEDADGDGFFDTWTLIPRGRETQQRSIRLKNESVTPLPLDALALRRFWGKALPDARNRSVRDAKQLEQSMGWRTPTDARLWYEAAQERNDPLIVRASHSTQLDRLMHDVLLWDLGGGFLARDTHDASPKEACDVRVRARGNAAPIVTVEELSSGAREALTPFSRVEIVGKEARVAGQVECHAADGVPDVLFFPYPVGERARVEVDPASPLPRPEAVRVDPWFGRGIAFESAPIAYRTYDGHLDVFAKSAPRLILRGNLGNYHEPQSWGMDALEVGDGPGLAGLYLLAGGRWTPLFGRDRVASQRVAAEGPLRAVVTVTLAAADTRIHRTWVVSGGDPVVAEDLTIEGSGPVTLAMALPRLAAGGVLPDSSGLWGYGTSAAGAGEIGLAGAVGWTRGRSMDVVEGAPAVRFTAAPGDTVPLAWVAGGRYYADTTASAWAARADSLLRR